MYHSNANNHSFNLFAIFVVTSRANVIFKTNDFWIYSWWFLNFFFDFLFYLIFEYFEFHLFTLSYMFCTLFTFLYFVKLCINLIRLIIKNLINHQIFVSTHWYHNFWKKMNTCCICNIKQILFIFFQFFHEYISFYFFKFCQSFFDYFFRSSQFVQIHRIIEFTYHVSCFFVNDFGLFHKIHRILNWYLLSKRFFVFVNAKYIDQIWLIVFAIISLIQTAQFNVCLIYNVRRRSRWKLSHKISSI